MNVYAVAMSMLLWACSTGWLLGCGPERVQKKREFARLNRTVELLQQAPNARKSPFVRELAGQECKHFCSFRDECAQAYGVHQRALDLLSEVQATLSDHEGQESSRLTGSGSTLTSAEAAQTTEKLAYAQSLLLVARSKTKACAAHQGRLVSDVGR